MLNISLKHYTNEALISELHILVFQERTLSLRVIAFLREVQCRSLHIEMGYVSLFTFCVEELKYSEGAAYYRINTMQIVEEMPEIKQAIETGELSMTTLSMVQSACKAKKKKTKIKVELKDKRELLEAVKGKSKKQTEAILHDHFPELRSSAKPESEKKLSDDLIGIFFNADPELMKKFKEIKDLTAHQNPSPSYQELFHMMSDFMLERIDPVRKAKRKAERQVKLKVHGKDQQRESEESKDKIQRKGESQLQPCEVESTVESTVEIPPPTPSHHCSAKTEQVIWTRAQSHCEHVDNKTGHRCSETRRLQLDHMIQYAVSYDSSEHNMQLLCTQHNLYRAKQWFGTPFMEQRMGRGSG